MRSLKSFIEPLFHRIKSGNKSILPKCSIRRYSNIHDIYLQRISQAKNSVIINIPAEDSVDTVLSECSQYGDINFAGVYNYAPKGFGDCKSLKNFVMRNVIVEFKQEISVCNLLDNVKSESSLFSGLDGTNIPYLECNKCNSKVGSQNKIPYIIDVSPKEEDFDIESEKYGSMSEKIETFYDSMKLSDIGYRLRFLALRKIELSITSNYPSIESCNLIPFGSCINSYGKYDCDVDMICIDDLYSLKHGGKNTLINDEYTTPYNDKIIMNENRGRDTTIRTLRAIEKAMHNLSTFHNISTVYKASIPIIKCVEPYTGIHCDIGASDMSGLPMSKMLYHVGSYDARVLPLVFYIRKWAKDRGHTVNNYCDKKLINNYGITCLVLFYLMNRSPAVIPPINEISHQFDKFNKKISGFQKSLNQETLEDLFYNFFNFYIKFYYTGRVMSLNTGQTYASNKSYPIQVEHPIHRDINVTRSIRKDDFDFFINDFRETWDLMNLKKKSRTMAL